MDLFADPDYVRDELEQRGPEAVRQPRAGDPLIAHLQRYTVLAFDAAAGLVQYEDDDGFRLQRARSSVWWDGSAWRCWGAEPRR